MSDKRRPVLTYDPACRDCRRDAGKDAAGATWQCGPHVAVERDRLLEQLAELKRSGKTERRFTNDYIKALHKAERQRDELRALLREVLEWHRCPWKHGASVEVIDLQLHAAWIARLDAALGGRDE